MIHQIAPQFFTTKMAETLAYYKDKLGFDCVGTWNDPPVYAIVARDGHRIHFRLDDPHKSNPDKYADKLLASDGVFQPLETRTAISGVGASHLELKFIT